MSDEFITVEQAEHLRTVRTAIQEIEHAASKATFPSAAGPMRIYCLGRVAEAAHRADDAVFQLLNVSANYGESGVAQAALRDRASEVAV